MATPPPILPRLLRSLASLLIRGPEAPYVLGDLDEAFERDLDRGVAVGRARRRYLRNALASAGTLAGGRLRIPSPGVSFLDLKLGLRMLRRQPALTAVAVFALSLGIPIGMIPFHLAQVLSPTLPFDEGERIVRLRVTDLEASRGVTRVQRDFRVWREDLTGFELLGAAEIETRNVVSEDGRAAPVQGSAITASAFDIVRVPPLLGRRLVEADERPGGPDVVVIGHDLWRSRLGADPEVVGRRIRIGGVPHEVVGVMPEGFLFPDRDHFWTPLRMGPFDHGWREGPSLFVFGRLAGGVSLAEANAELDVVSRRIAREHPETHRLVRAEVIPFAGDNFYGSPLFWIVQLLALLLLTVACGNVGTLILARTAMRSREIAVRTALGASRARVVGQLFVEALVLALVGAGFGLWIGDVAGGRLQVIFEPQGLPFWFDLGVTWRTALTVLGLAAFSATVAGVLPALKATGRGVQGNLQRASAGASGLRFGGLSTVLIVAEVALATAFLAIGGQMLPSVLQDPSGGMGVAPEEYLVATLNVHAGGARTIGPQDTAVARTRVRAAHLEIVRRLGAAPGVRAVAVASRLPGDEHPREVVEVEDAAPAVHELLIAGVDVDYFRSLGHPPLLGRDFRRSDVLDAPGQATTAAVVNTSFVDAVLGGASPLGRRLRRVSPDGAEPGPWLEIVGVVGHLGMNEINPNRDAGLYLPVASGELDPVRLAVRVGRDPASFVPDLRRVAAEVDAGALIRDAMPMEAALRLSDARTGAFWGALLVTMIAAVAVVLSAAGLYALVAFTVSERRREIGIRTALGARTGSIVVTIARRALGQLILGVLAGLVLRGVLELEIGLASDPSMHEVDQVALFAVTAGLTLVVGLLSCLPPLLRGLRIRPVEVLKDV